jgi:hypothetical protein
MALNSANVRVAVTGAVSVADKGTVLPTDATTALKTPDYTDLGFVSSDGVKVTLDKSTSDVKAWQNSTVVREVITDAKFTIQFKLVETTADTLALYYGSDVKDGKINIDPAKGSGRHVLVIDVVDGDNLERTVAAEAEITATGELTYAGGDAVAYDLTFTCYPSSAHTDDEGNPVAAVKYLSYLDDQTPPAEG